MDLATGQVQPPVAQILPASNPTQNPIAYTMIQQQFQQSLWQWQRIMFGSLNKSTSPNLMLQALQHHQALILISNACVQKTGHRGFAWVIALE